MPVPNQVFPRDCNGYATIPLELGGAGDVSLTGPSGLPVAYDLVPTGERTAELRGVPTGGPYTLTVGATTVPGLLVGDIWLLGGQSNMEGCGKLIGLEPPHPLVHLYGMDDRWSVAEEPLHWLSAANASVHWELRGAADADRAAHHAADRAGRECGAGLGLPFAKHLVETEGVPIGLVASAHGGTSMDQWSPELRDLGQGSLYGATLERAANVGGRVAGILWYQGESDAWADEPALAYADKMRALVAAFRQDLGDAQLPFLLVQLGRFYQWEAPAELVRGWDVVREAQRLLESELAPAAVVPAIDLSLDDAIHVDTPGLRRLGVRMARAARTLAYGASLPLGPRPATPEVSADRLSIRVPFTGIVGRLTERGRVVGVRVSAGESGVAIADCRVVPSGCGLLIALTEPLPSGASLHYGAGLSPTCPLRDEADMPVPTFGPLPLD